MDLVTDKPGIRRHRPYGLVRHYVGLLRPRGTVALRLAMERNQEQRLRHLADAGQDRLRQRIRPTRPRMRTLIAAPGGRLYWRGVPAPPPPGPAGAIVRPVAIGTCDADAMIAMGASPFPLPLRLGHECVAEVLSVGGEVATIRPGQHVVVPYQISCGECPACRAGRTANCLAVPPVSMYGFGLTGGPWGGALADELAVPYADAMLVPLPEGLAPAAAASVADNVIECYRHVAPHLPALLSREPGARLLVLGPLDAKTRFSASGPIYAALIAKALGAPDVVLVDARPYARDFAERLGLRAVPPAELKAYRPAPLVADLTTTSRGLAVAVASTAPDGVCSTMVSLERMVRIPGLLAYGRNVTMHISRPHARPLIPPVLDLMRTGRFRPETVISTVASLDDAPAALREHFLGGGTKTVLIA
jgi:alcohol dehydrogenase